MSLAVFHRNEALQEPSTNLPCACIPGNSPTGIRLGRRVRQYLAHVQQLLYNQTLYENHLCLYDCSKLGSVGLQASTAIAERNIRNAHAFTHTCIALCCRLRWHPPS
eukprot:1161945-Pelagomonas_calceolata.AAC.2